jgi:Tfp pilus assembly protein PilZ
MMDRRKSPRIELHLYLTIKGEPAPQAIRNFGLYGVFIQTENPSRFKTGDEINVVMKLLNQTENMLVNGRVAHVSDKGIGVEFTDLRPQDAMAMELCYESAKHAAQLPGT